MASTAQKITFRNFRVVITGNASALSLLRMAENEYSARCIAQHAADRNGSAAVWVERWQGTATSGVWLAVCRIRAGVAARGDQPATTRKTPTTKSGDVIECVLLPNKTRKNGWMALVVDLAIAGPVTGTTPHGLALAEGQKVRLKVCGIKPEAGFIQLAWA